MGRLKVNNATNNKIDKNVAYGDDVKNTQHGFSRLKPFSNINRACDVSVNANKRNTEIYKQFVIRNKPYSFFITLTFARNMDRQQCCNCVNTLLHMVNNKIFGRKHRNTESNYITGFLFIEDHKFGNSKNDIHMHMLVKYHEKYDGYRFCQYESIFREAAAKVLDDRDRRVFNDNCIDIRKVRDDGAIGYCFKQVWDKKLNRVKAIGKEGLSDSL